MSGSSRAPLRRRLVARICREERGGVLVMVAIMLPVLLAAAALVVDFGMAFMLKRHLQSSADAAAFAAAQDLPDEGVADATAREYSASAGGRNVRTGQPPVTTEVTFPAAGKVKVEQSATNPQFFSGILDFAGIDVTASAVASKTSPTTGTPLAMYVHELCGAPSGDKGLIANGQNMRVEGGIHVNGQFKVGNSGFNAVGPATVYRPSAGSPAGPTHPGSCNGSAPLRIEDVGDSKYCTGCSGGQVTDPSPGPFRDWVTPYHTEAIVKASVPACTHSPNSDVTLTSSFSGTRVYCLPSDKKFTLSGNVSGTLTVIAGTIEVGGSGTLRPASTTHPVLFYATGASTSERIVMNPSGAYDWNGYIIARKAGIKINAASVTSPFNGLLEAEWLEVNGENFRMLGTFPDSSSGGTLGAVRLEE